MAYTPFSQVRNNEELMHKLKRIRYVITDLDGTMLHGASALVDSQANPSYKLAQTLCELQNAGIEVIPCTGRNRAMVRENARMLGLHGWIAEMGGILCTSQGRISESHYFCADMAFDETQGLTPHELIEQTGVVAKLLQRWPNQLEPYNDNGKGYQYREVTVALRGCVDENEAQAMLDACGLNLYLADNGLISRISGQTTLMCNPENPVGMHTYHITPQGLDKGSGAKKYLELKGWKAENVLCCGDSPADIDMADVGNVFMFMKNGLAHTKAQEKIADCDANATIVSDKPDTDGWIEMMQLLLDIRA